MLDELEKYDFSTEKARKTERPEREAEKGFLVDAKFKDSNTLIFSFEPTPKKPIAFKGFKNNELEFSKLLEFAEYIKDCEKTEYLTKLIERISTKTEDFKLKEITNLKFKPYDFQPKDAEILLQNKCMINGNEMGCGKTFEQVIQ